MEKMMEVVSIKQVTSKKKSPYALQTIKCPEDAVKVIHHYIGNEANEVFMALMLNTKNQVVGIHKISVGSLNSSIVHPRETFKAAILNNAASIILGHNHPSNNPVESPDDVEVTERLIEAGNVLGIEVLDHIIVTEYMEDYTSLRHKGVI